jgi:hypothetical protein
MIAGVRPSGLRVPHSASLLPPALLAPACNACLAHDTCFLPSLAPPADRRAPGPNGFDKRVMRPARCGHPSSRPPSCTHATSALPISRSLSRVCSLQSASLASFSTPMPPGCLVAAVPADGRWAHVPKRLGLSPAEPGAPTSTGGCYWCSWATGSHPDDQNRPAQASLPLCCKFIFQVF